MLTRFRNTMLIALTVGGLTMFTLVIACCESPRSTSTPEAATPQEIIASKVAKKTI